MGEQLNLFDFELSDGFDSAEGWIKLPYEGVKINQDSEFEYTLTYGEWSAYLYLELTDGMRGLGKYKTKWRDDKHETMFGYFGGNIEKVIKRNIECWLRWIHD